MIRLVTLRPLEEAPIKGSNAVKGGLGAATKTTSKQIVEDIGDDAKKIAKFTGTRANAVQEFIDTNNIDGAKLAKYVAKGSLSDKMKFVSAIAGNPGNKVQKMIISKFAMNESMITEGRRANDFFSDSKHGKAIHSLLKGNWNGQKVKKYLDDTSTNDVKWARISDFIANSLGLNLRKYNTYGEQSSAIIDAMAKLYKEFISTTTTESVNEAKFKKGDIVTITDGPWKGEKAKLKSTYRDQFGGSNTKDWSVYIYSMKDEVSWVRPTEMKLYGESVTEAKYDPNLGHYLEERGKIFVDSNFINKSSGILPNSELKHMGFGEFYIDTPKGSVQFARQGNKIEGFVGRVHKIYDDQNGKLVKQLIDGMQKQKRIEPIMPM